MTGGGQDGFLGRWSRRKLADPEQEAEVSGAPPEAEAEAPSVPEKTDAEILQELGLPDPDTLGEGDDFSGFMGGAIPARLRNRALRKLWLTNPVLANLDELVDYGDDFTDAATVVENLQTAWQVGKGFLKDAVDDEESDSPDAADLASETTPEADAGLPPDEKALENRPPDTAPSDAAAPEAVAESAALPVDLPDAIPQPRRMRFRVNTT